MNALTNQDTICAPSTPNGSGAISVIRVSGKDALKIASRIFSKDLTKVASHTIHFGIISTKVEVVDEVVAAVFHAGKSFTGENVVELSCHGSMYITQRILSLLLERGCRMATPGEFTMRAYFNNRMDLSQAEAVADLIASTSKKSHDVAINQMRGGYSDYIQHLRQQLMDFASLIELENDFSEEDVEFASREELQKLVVALKEKLTELVESFTYGNAIKNGINTVIAGRPNAGKSTLLNALINEERAIVSAIPGTTRDTIQEQLIIDGITYNLIDTAGIREAEDEIEKIGVERTLDEVKKSNIIVYVYDAFELSMQEVKEDINRIYSSDLSVILLGNKSDKINISTKRTVQSGFPHLSISAKNKEGITLLKKELGAITSSMKTSGDTIVVNVRHFEAFTNALKDMKKVEEAIEMEIPADLLAMDIRSAIRHLASITGEITTDDLLGNIFANFCIGK